jgi:hypothetical protein
MSSASLWHAKGALDAASGRSWLAGARFSPRIRRAWLAGWVKSAVSINACHGNDLPVFHMDRWPVGDVWTSAELDLLKAGRDAIPPMPLRLTARLLGRSLDAVKSRARRCGFAARTTSGAALRAQHLHAGVNQ